MLSVLGGVELFVGFWLVVGFLVLLLFLFEISCLFSVLFEVSSFLMFSSWGLLDGLREGVLIFSFNVDREVFNNVINYVHNYKLYFL